MKQVTIFYLPTAKRPEEYPPLENDIGEWWHTGIIFDDIIYECFSGKRKSITNYIERKPQLDKLGAVYYSYFIDNVEEKIHNNIEKGYSCDNFVESVLGKPLNSNPTVINHFENTYKEKTISFPADEHMQLLDRLDSKKPIYTTRIQNERGKYKVGQNYISKLNDTTVILKLIGKSEHTSLTTHPFFKDLTDDQKLQIGNNSYDILKFEKVN